MTIDEFINAYPNIGNVLAYLIDLPEMEEDIQIGFENVKKSYSHNQLKEWIISSNLAILRKKKRKNSRVEISTT